MDNKKLIEITDEKINSIISAGNDAIKGMFSFLIDTINSMQERIEQLEEENNRLKAIIAKDSHNSHKPPGTDEFKKKKKKIKNLRTKSNKKNGGQKGHNGTTLKLSDNPDKKVELKVTTCDCCNKSLEKAKVIDYERRQKIDIPPLKPIITEYQAEIKHCNDCDRDVKATFPDEVKQTTQYGNTVKKMMIYFRCWNLIPIKRLKELFSDIFGISLSEATINNTISKTDERLQPFIDGLIIKLLKSGVLNFDETGIRINGKRCWVHSISNLMYTYYYPHEKRGREAIEEIGILPNYKGKAIHDFYRSYLIYECIHGLCNAHHLRELIYLEEEEKQRWAGKMKKLLLDIKEEVYKQKLKKKLITKKRLSYYEKKYKEIIRSGFKENPYAIPKIKKRGCIKKGKALCLLERFRDRIKEVLAFMYYLDAPFDNNQAERDIRMVKLYQKISGCFRTFAGARHFCNIRSFLSTVRKHGLNILESIEKLFIANDFNSIFMTSID